jgi:hypothetical protein
LALLVRFAPGRNAGHISPDYLLTLIMTGCFKVMGGSRKKP